MKNAKTIGDLPKRKRNSNGFSLEELNLFKLLLEEDTNKLLRGETELPLDKGFEVYVFNKNLSAKLDFLMNKIIINVKDENKA